MKPSSPDDWTYRFEDTEKTFIAEIHPKTRWIGVVSFIATVCTVSLGAVSWSLASQGFLLATILASFGSIFAVALWLGQRCSFWRMKLDFIEGRAYVEVKRSFDPVHRFDAELEELTVAEVGDSSIQVGWNSDPNIRIFIPFRSTDEANQVRDKLLRWACN